jgi:serine/threonine-protein kinase BUR1
MFRPRLFFAMMLTVRSCVFGEMLEGKPILSGESDQRQLEIIFDLVGTPNDDNMPGWQSLPGAQGLKVPPRPPNLAERFKKYVSSSNCYLL